MRRHRSAAILLALALSVSACGQKAEKRAETAETTALEPFTAADREMYSIAVDGIQAEEDGAYAVLVTLKNKTADKTLKFSLEHASGDKLVLDSYLGTELAPGKTVKENIEFRKSPYYAFSDFSDIRLDFEVEDEADPLARRDQQDEVHIYPHGGNSDARFERQAKKRDQVIAEKDTFKVVFLGGEFNDRKNYLMHFYLENNGAKEMRFAIDYPSLNGKMIANVMTVYLEPGERRFDTLRFSKSKIEENQITAVHDAAFSLKVTDGKNISSALLFDDTIRLKP